MPVHSGRITNTKKEEWWCEVILPASRTGLQDYRITNWLTGLQDNKLAYRITG
jgi:hypothetical protein